MSSYYFALLTNNRFNLNAKFVLNRKSFHHQVYYSFQCHHDIISKLLLKMRLHGKQNKDVVFMFFHQLKGGSQAQSSSIQCFDAALGLVHPPGKLPALFI